MEASTSQSLYDQDVSRFNLGRDATNALRWSNLNTVGQVSMMPWGNLLIVMKDQPQPDEKVREILRKLDGWGFDLTDAERELIC